MNMSNILDARVVSEKAFVRENASSKVTKIRVADNASRKNDRNPCRFLNAEAWGVIGDQLAKLSKGDVVSLSGELVVDMYTDKQGQERRDDLIKVTAFRVQKSTSFFEPGTSTKTAPEETPAPTDDDLPF